MVRVAKTSDPKRIAELKKKIQSRIYVRDAIQNIAEKLSEEIVQNRSHS